MHLEQAIAAAQKYLAQLNQEAPFHPNYEYIVAEPVDYCAYWYFDFRLNHRLDLPQHAWENFAGSPGYLIWKTTGQAELIGWQQHQQLLQREATGKLAEELLAGAMDLRTLRKHLKLPLPELLSLKQALENPLYSPAQKKERLVQVLLAELEG